MTVVFIRLIYVSEDANLQMFVLQLSGVMKSWKSLLFITFVLVRQNVVCFT